MKHSFRFVNSTLSSPKVYGKLFFPCFFPTFYVIWNLDLKLQKCKIALNDDGRSENSCNGGKSLRNTSSAQSYLQILNFSADDVGLYTCESAFKGGNENYEIHVAIIGKILFLMNVFLEDVLHSSPHKDNKTVAVCKAERGNPAANISWSHTGNLFPVEKRHDSDGFFTLESHLELPEGMDTQHLSCIISHPLWEKAEILKLNSKKGQISAGWIQKEMSLIINVGDFFFQKKKQIPSNNLKVLHLVALRLSDIQVNVQLTALCQKLLFLHFWGRCIV
uniref:Cell surface glycoprotein CD200 receptor 1-like n=1 Tax=Acanthochromis polyacanthus TaxID=80966 RepID=A0A3Q1EJW6_9TELE